MPWPARPVATPAGRSPAAPARRGREPPTARRAGAARVPAARSQRPERRRGCRDRPVRELELARVARGQRQVPKGERVEPRSASSVTRMKLPADLAIFRPSISRNSPWTQCRAGTSPVIAAVWAISSSWCGKTLSMPPVWMSNGAEVAHRHRGALEVPAGETLAPARVGHLSSRPGPADFQSAKSAGSRLSGRPRRAWPARSRQGVPDSWP